jgi:hypothetical protein
MGSVRVRGGNVGSDRKDDTLFNIITPHPTAVQIRKMAM